MIETNVNKIITYNYDARMVEVRLFYPQYQGAETYTQFIPNAVVLSGINNMTASEGTNIQSYKQEWISILETQIIGASDKTFTYNGISFTEQEIAANLTVNVKPYQYINSYGQIAGVTLSYAGIDLTFSFTAPSKTIAQYIGYENSNEINIYGFYGFSIWQGNICWNIMHQS